MQDRHRPLPVTAFSRFPGFSRFFRKVPTLSETAATMSSATPPVQATSQVLGACPHDCPDTCSLVTTVEDGIAKRVQGNPAHPHTGGVLCAKVSKYTERSYHPERVLTPLRRVGP